MMPLKLVESKGFAFSEYQQHGNTTKHKPGWIAADVGSSMDVLLDTRFTAPANSSSAAPRFEVPRQRAGGVSKRGALPPGMSALVVGFLRSYEHMGRASLTCVKGCNCAPTVIDAHNPETVSVLELHEVPVTASSACVVRLEVLKESSSPGGEHKFKLIQIAVRGSAASTS